MRGKLSQADIRHLADPTIPRPRGRAVRLDAVILKLGTEQYVDWTCPVCGYRNRHLWFGRDIHLCTGCDQPTEIKGASNVSQ